MKSLSNGIVYTRKLDGWTISWESNDKYRHWCYQQKESFNTNLLVVMLNPGSLSGDGSNLKADTTLNILREVCGPINTNVFVINLFDYANPSPKILFQDWDKRDSSCLIFKKIVRLDFDAYIMGYGDYENHCDATRPIAKEMNDRVELIHSTFECVKQISLPKNRSGTPKHPMRWRREKITQEIISLLSRGLGKDN